MVRPNRRLPRRGRDQAVHRRLPIMGRLRWVVVPGPWCTPATSSVSFAEIAGDSLSCFFMMDTLFLFQQLLDG